MNIIYKFNEQQLQELHALYQNEWWTKGRTFEDTKCCVEGSQINVGLIDTNESLQAYARVLTDYTFKALIFDIIVSNDYRGNGLGERIISLIKNHKELHKVKHFELYCLPEMFQFYEKYGFISEVGEIKLMRYTNA